MTNVKTRNGLKYTREKWEAVGANGKGDATVLARTRVHGNPRYIARVYGAGILASASEATEELAGNARLIAAAPELYEAMERIAGHESRSDRRHLGMVDASELEDLRRIARAILARIDNSAA